MADPRDELVYADMANDIPQPRSAAEIWPAREPLRIRVSPYDTPPPSETGWGGFGSGGRPTGRLFEPDLKPAPAPTGPGSAEGEPQPPWQGGRLFEPDQAPAPPKPQWQPGALSLVPIARGIGSLVQGARDAWNAPPSEPAPAVAPPPARDPTAGPRQMWQQGYPSAEYSSMFKGPASLVPAAVEASGVPDFIESGKGYFNPESTPGEQQQRAQQQVQTGANVTGTLIGTGVTGASVRGGASAGVFGGRLAKGFDPNVEKLAASMEANGVSPQKIWRETGMVKFADGKWAHEISDLGAYYKGDVDSIASRIFDQKYPDRAGTYGQGVRPGNMVRSDEAKAEALLKMQQKLPMFLPDVLHHPELFKKYPELLKMPVSQDAMMHAQGAYVPEAGSGLNLQSRSIRYREEMQPGKMARGATFDTLLHEVQHAIAQIEGFAKGSNTNAALALKEGTPANIIYKKELEKMPVPMELDDYLKAHAARGNPKGVGDWVQYYDKELKEQEIWRRQAQEYAVDRAYLDDAGENLANLSKDRKDFKPDQASFVYPPGQMRLPLEEQGVQFNQITNPAGTGGQQAQMGSILRPTMHEGPQMSEGPTPFSRPGRTMREENWLPVKPTVLDPRRVFSPGIYENPRVIAEKAAENVAAEHPALKELFGVTRADLYDISQQGRRKGNMEPDIFMPNKPGTSYKAEGIMTPANERRILDTLGEGLKHRGLREGMVPWYVMDPMFQHMVKLVGKEQAIKDYQRFNATTAPFSASSEVMTELNRGTAANMYAKRGDYETFHRFGGADRQKLPPGFPDDMRDVAGHAYHAIQSDPVVRWLATGKHGYGKEIVKIPTYHAASGVPETGFQTRWPIPDAHYTRGVGMADVRDTTKPGISMKGPEYRSMAPWYREKIAEPLGLEAVPAQALQWGTMARATGVDTPIGAGKLELFSQRVWERARELGIDPKTLRDEVLKGNQSAIGLLTAGAGGAAGMGALVDPSRYQPGGT